MPTWLKFSILKMLHLLHPLGNHLTKSVPKLNWVDVYQGQFSDNEDAASLDAVLAPAVLLEIPEVPWSDGQGGHQDGAAQLRVMVAVLLNDPSHHTRKFPDPAAANPLSPFLRDLATLTLAADVHEAVRLWKPSASRRNTRCYYYGSFYVVEHQYAFPVAHEPTPLLMVSRPDLEVTGKSSYP